MPWEDSQSCSEAAVLEGAACTWWGHNPPHYDLSRYGMKIFPRCVSTVFPADGSCSV